MGSEGKDFILLDMDESIACRAPPIIAPLGCCSAPLGEVGGGDKVRQRGLPSLRGERGPSRARSAPPERGVESTFCGGKVARCLLAMPPCGATALKSAVWKPQGVPRAAVTTSKARWGRAADGCEDHGDGVQLLAKEGVNCQPKRR